MNVRMFAVLLLKNIFKYRYGIVDFYTKPPNFDRIFCYSVPIYISKGLLLDRMQSIKLPKKSPVVYFWMGFLKYSKLGIFRRMMQHFTKRFDTVMLG